MRGRYNEIANYFYQGLSLPLFSAAFDRAASVGRRAPSVNSVDAIPVAEREKS
jgi:hypothetical protein